MFFEFSPGVFTIIFHFAALQFYTAFMCEREVWKANYLIKAHPSVKFLFRDMQELHKGEAFDVISGGKVNVPFATWPIQCEAK